MITRRAWLLWLFCVATILTVATAGTSQARLDTGAHIVLVSIAIMLAAAAFLSLDLRSIHEQSC